jgi:hypothetical protein
MSETTPAGWYPAPHAGNELRYWDGTAWHAAPAYLPADGANAAASAPPAAPTMPPPYGTGAPGYPPYPGGPRMPTRPQGLAITALVIGIAAFLSAWIPFLGAVIALVGLVFGVLALIKRQPKGLAVTGTVLSGLATVWSIIVVVSLAAVWWGPSSSVSSGNEAAPLPEASEPLEDGGSDSYAPETGPGSVSDPLPLPYESESSFGSDYTAEVRLVDEDATDEIIGWNPYNDSDITGYRYVLVEMTVTGTDPEGTEASYASYDLSLATPDGSIYPSSFVVADEDTTLLSDIGTIADGETVAGLVAYLVPEDATELLLSDYANYYSF